MNGKIKDTTGGQGPQLILWAKFDDDEPTKLKQISGNRVEIILHADSNGAFEIKDDKTGKKVRIYCNRPIILKP